MATQQRKSGTKRPVKRRRRKDPNRFLYIAISLIFISLVLASIIICTLVSCDNDETDSQYDDESSISSTVSTDKGNNVSGTVSNNTSDESSQSQGNTSNDNSSGNTDENSGSTSVPDNNKTTTERYEDYIGVKYAIDMTEYEQYVCPENDDEFVFLVSVSHPIGEDYVPADLVKCTNMRKGRPDYYSYINSTANKALEAFLKEAKIAGFDDITVSNAYRSYATQSMLFNNYVNSDISKDYVCDTCAHYIDISYFPEKVTKRDGCSDCKGILTEEDGVTYCTSCMSVADKKQVVSCSTCNNAVRRPTMDETKAHVMTYSAPPGTSEHQSGLCVDMHNLLETSSKFDNTPEALWLAANAHRFGFILRYPPNTQHITGYKHESWHFRFVGREVATEIYERGITLDEYLA